MIEYVKACKIALDYFKSNCNKDTLAKALDAETVWIFYGGKADAVEVGGYGITVDKTSGAVEKFILPSPKNFAILKKAKAIELPDKF